MRRNPVTVPAIVFILLLSGVTAMAILKPKFDLDSLIYVASAVHNRDAGEISRIAYGSLSHIPDVSSMMTGEYQSGLASNPYYLCEQLPFYAIKPLYIAALSSLHALGLPYATALVLLSAGPYFLLGLLLWKWVTRHLGNWQALGTCGAIMLFPALLFIGRLVTPDSLGLLASAIAFYLILEREAYFYGCAVLVISIWVRTDMMILAGITMLLLLYRRRIDWAQFACLSSLALASNLAINHFSGNYGYRALLYHTFVQHIAAAGEVVVVFTPRMYVGAFARDLYLMVLSSEIFVFAFMVLVTYKAVKSANLYFDFALLTVVYRVIFYILFPSVDVRYGALMYVIPPLALIFAVNGFHPSSHVHVNAQHAAT